MNTSMIKINETAVSIKEFQGQRVVTFKDVDTVHGRPEGTARRNFNENKNHLIENVDYFTVALTTNEIRTQFGAGKNAGRTLTLLAESGYLMLVKSFTDDLAWTVQRQLVNSYFRVQAQQTGQPTAYHKALAESKLNNSRARLSSVWLKLADRVDLPEYKQICMHYASGVLTGSPVLPLPESTEQHLSAKEVGDLFGISAQKVGSLANANKLKTDDFGKWYHDKSPYSSKEVDTFKYNRRAVERFRELLEGRVAS